MLPSSLLRRALLLNTPFLPGLSRAQSTMSAPLYTLDKSVFNTQLYSRLRELWYPKMSPNATHAGPEAMQRWFGFGLSQEQKDSFDGQCHEISNQALQSISPEKVHLPAFRSYEEDLAQASTLAGPLLAEVKEASTQDERKGTDMLLSLILLLDQMPRNIYRTPATLPLVYNHYDRLALALLRGSMTFTPNPLSHPFYTRRPLYMQFLLMPLLHTEHLPSHAVWEEYMVATETAVKEAGDSEALEFLGKGREAEEKHLLPLKRFGRYPFRNECLGRESSEEEKEWLKEGETFGVEVGKGAAESGSGGEKGRDEL